MAERSVQNVTVSYDSSESLKCRGVAGPSHSGVGAMPIGRNRRKRISILKKLREKLVTADNVSPPAPSLTSAVSTDPAALPIADGQPTTVIRVGTVSSCGSGTARSWRVVDEFLRNRFDFTASPSRQSTLSDRSLASGKTVLYDDKYSQIDNNSTLSDQPPPNFRTVIKVEEDGCGTSSAAISTPHLENVNVIVERSNNNDDSDNSSLFDSSSPSVGNCGSELDSATGTIREPNNSNTAKPHHACRKHHQPPPAPTQPSTTCVVTQQPTLTNVGPIFGHCQNSGATTAGATSPIELTNWRLRQDFDAEPAARNCGGENGGQTQRPHDSNGAGLPNLNMLLPDDLPRLYPGWNIPPIHPPFRFDEEFEEEPKGCCGSGRFSHSMMIRVFIAVISLIGLSCVVVGIVLGALTVSGSTRLTLCILMIGVGVVLIIVSGIAWRLTSLDPAITPSCWTILGLRAQRPQSVFPERRSRAAYYRVRNIRRPMAPFCGMMQSEFAWRPPPPTYQATMQELRLQTFLCTRNQREACGPSGSPPPTYRSDNENDNARPSLNDFIQRISRPPSYRSHDNVQSTCIEERPLLPNDTHPDISSGTLPRMEENAESIDANVEGSAIAASENVNVDDKMKLVASDHLQRSFSNDNLPSTSTNQRTPPLSNRRRVTTNSSAPSLVHLDRANRNVTKPDTVSVIDCSAADPVVTMATEQQRPLTSAAIRFTSPQTARPQLTQRRYHGGMYAQSAAANEFYRQAVLPRNGGILSGPRPPPPPPQIRYSMPPFFAAYHHNRHHGRHRNPPLMPIRMPPVGGGQIRWRQMVHHQPAPPPPNQIRLPTVAVNVREDQMTSSTNGDPFLDQANGRDPSYV